jgi:hypothetical protein
MNFLRIQDFRKSDLSPYSFTIEKINFTENETVFEFQHETPVDWFDTYDECLQFALDFIKKLDSLDSQECDYLNKNHDDSCQICKLIRDE